MNGNQIRNAFLAYYKNHKHAEIPSSALVPENDPTTLFTGSGMQPLVPYLMGETHPKGKRLVDSQKCFRAEDIEEVGDNRHTTFFEMLGNWSLGDYFKQEQIPWFYYFLTQEVGLDPARLYVTVFAGDEASGIDKDNEAIEIWQRLFRGAGVDHDVADIGSEADGAQRGMHDSERIFAYDASKNWWSRAGQPSNMPAGEPGGPDSEVFYDFGIEHDSAFGEHCHPNCDCGRFLEIGNNVFMEYKKEADGGFAALPNQNVDFGGGLERITAAANHEPDVFKIDLLAAIISAVAARSDVSYEENTHAYRIIADHLRGAVFMIGDGVSPSNTEQGYFVRRLLRRAVRYADQLHISAGALPEIAHSVIDTYAEHYENLPQQATTIKEAIASEETQFRRTLEHGMKQFNKIGVRVTLPMTKVNGKISQDTSKTPKQERYISGKNAYKLFTTYGFPIELTQEIAHERNMEVDMKSFYKLMKEHREASRAGAAGKFQGGLSDHSKQVVAYHTTTHLLLAALQKHLGGHVHQAGSNITDKRLRFDFTHDEKLSDEIKQAIEHDINTWLSGGGSVSVETMPKHEAEADTSIEGSFWERYPDEVKVYTITATDGTVLSRELCGGPHVGSFGQIDGRFQISKEESGAAGVRRIKGVLTQIQ